MAKLVSLMHFVGSIRVGTVLLMLLVVMMACATVLESTHGREWAAAAFYDARWFEALLYLLGLNVLLAVFVRYPFSPRQFGFVVTHASMLLIIAGALVTRYFGVHGQVGVAEGQTVNYYRAPQESLTVIDRKTGTRADLDLGSKIPSGFDALAFADGPTLHMDDLKIEVDRYVPDSIVVEEVLDDTAHGHPAVEVLLADPESNETAWVFEDERVGIGATTVAFRLLQREADLAALVASGSTTDALLNGVVRIEVGAARHELSVKECMDEPVLLGAIDLTVRVLRFWPHATVGSNNRIVNASPKPVNPAIEVELAWPDDVEKRVAFAKFPDMESLHGPNKHPDTKVTFVLPTILEPIAPVEILSSAGGEMYVRFAWEGTEPVTHKLEFGSPVQTPWPSSRLSVLRRYDHARKDRSIAEADSIRKNRVPAIHLQITTPQARRELWVQRHEPRMLKIGGAEYNIDYGDMLVPLGFDLKLERFRIGYYPGGGRPRSFESHVSLVDPSTITTENRIVSMNRPAEFGGFSIFQSSYRLDPGITISFLSVSRDPGRLIVYMGYIGTLIGMLIVIGTRKSGRSAPIVPAPVGLRHDATHQPPRPTPFVPTEATYSRPMSSDENCAGTSGADMTMKAP